MRCNQFVVLFIVVSLFACKKESVPPVIPPSSTNAVFTLTGSGGICSNTVVGVYTLGKALDASNKVVLLVNVTSPGSYKVATSTVYGIQFSDTGSFSGTGSQTIILKGAGNPIAAGTFTFLFTAGGSSCSFNVTVVNPGIPTLGDNDNMLFGNPGNAAMVTDSINNYLLRKSYYAASYSEARGIPNWVAWHLHAADLGTVSRQEDFRPDETLPAGWYQVPDNAYSGSGFDKGHNVPSGDRTSTAEANSATFLMTNMIPQAPVHNQTTWARMEDSLRRLANLGYELYIVMGSYGVGGTGSNGYATTVNGGKVTVPASIWKIAIVIPNGDNDTSRVNTNTRIIGVNIPNNNSVNGNWKNYRVSVDAIEDATGYDLLGRLPATLQTLLEAKVDNF